MAEITQIRTSEELETLFGSQQLVLLLKHSTACPSSAHAKSVFTEFSNEHPDLAVYAMVSVIESRSVSNEVAERLDVRHQSPQVLMVDGGKMQWHASHYGISHEALEEVLQRSAG
ncbi:MAG: bacillithiol system redox-active protein YtxJ [Candidatus Latescibacteria bacterium]|jgi:bacillithiol system protein YtxJ|nr:bacillithiol system redox-active protein YtxJ [Candidatus Latescibacterota bacterium]